MNADEQSHYASYRSDVDARVAAHQSLCTRFGVEVAWGGESRGKVLRASRPVRAGEVVFVEDPLVGMAHLRSERILTAGGHGCARCLRTVGGLQSSWARVAEALQAEQEEAEAARRRRMMKQKKGKGKKGKATEEEVQQEEHVQAPLPLQLPDELPFLSQSQTAAPSSSSAPSTLYLPAPTGLPCLGGCPGRSYCSPRCRDVDFAHSHELLCPGHGDAVASAHAVLLKHAAANNEIFMLAAQALARMTLSALGDMAQLDSVKELLTSKEGPSDAAAPPPALLPFALRLHRRLSTLPAAESSSIRSELATASARAAAPFRAFCGGVWWEHVAVPQRVAEDPTEEEEYRQALCGVAERSLTLLGGLVDAQLQSVIAAAELSDPSCPRPTWDELVTALSLDDLWSLSLFGHVLSSFERNNIGWAAPTALGVYVAHVRALSEEQRQDAVRLMGGEDVWQEMQQRCDGGAGAVSATSAPPLPCGIVEGTGLFVVACCMNHSCDPNVSLRSKCEQFTDAAQRDELRRLLQGQPGTATDSNNAASTAPMESTSLPLDSVLLDRSAVFVALRDIALGDELNISYIDLVEQQEQGQDDAAESHAEPSASSSTHGQLREVPFATRQQQLRAYDFTCQCVKCTRERPEQA